MKLKKWPRPNKGLLGHRYNKIVATAGSYNINKEDTTTQSGQVDDT
jgi:hypothetical protein